MDASEEQRRSRRFGLADGLILIAALSLTLVVLRATGWFARFPVRVGSWWDTWCELLWLRPWSHLGQTRQHAAFLLSAQMLEEILVGLLSSVLLGLTLALPLLRLRRPRPPFREVVRQSGFVACLAVIAGTLITVDLWAVANIDVGYWVVVASGLMLAWPLLGMFPWRPEASWIDRLGRAVGWGWIIVLAAATAAAYLDSWA